MNRHILSFILGFCVAGLLVFFIMHYRSQRGSAAGEAGEFMVVRQAVEKNLRDLSQDITARLAAFGSEAASDQLFALRLIAENNPSAPEVADKAMGFMAPMGFAFLSIVDSAGVILSSGHFPASRGDRLAEGVFRRLSEEPKLMEDNVAGTKTLSLQARRSFVVADSITYYALGGVAVDGALLARLSPFPEVKILLRRGGEVTGMDGITTISEVTDNTVLLNGARHPAFKVMLDFAGEGEAPELIAVMTGR
jgi:hypothetical protein